jgi:microcystin-dependent protein
MPGTPPTSPNVNAPRYADTDTADFAADVNAVTDAFDAYIGAMGQPPVGAVIAWAGSGDPPPGAGGTWVISDGRLVSTTTYPRFVTASPGNVYNGGVSPGSNLIRLPDRRGVKGVGAINMGSAAGAGANDNAHVQLARGATGGEVLHVTQVTEMPSHAHSDAGHAHNFGQNMPGSSPGTWVGADVLPNNGTGSILVPETSGGVNNLTGTQGGAANIQATGGSGGHNNVDPAVADSYIVRIA